MLRVSSYSEGGQGKKEGFVSRVTFLNMKFYLDELDSIQIYYSCEI